MIERFAKDFPRGTVLFREGELGSTMFVIQSGEVEISRVLYEESRVLAVLSPGEFFGEMAIINQRPRSATAVTRTDSRLLVIDSNVFESMVRNKTEIAVRMIQSLAGRLESANRQLELLLLKDANHRVVRLLLQLADQYGNEDCDVVFVPTNVESLAEKVAIDVELVQKLLQRLIDAQLLKEANRQEYAKQGYILPQPQRLAEFLEFLEIKQRYLATGR